MVGLRRCRRGSRRGPSTNRFEVSRSQIGLGCLSCNSRKQRVTDWLCGRHERAARLAHEVHQEIKSTHKYGSFRPSYLSLEYQVHLFTNHIADLRVAKLEKKVSVSVCPGARAVPDVTLSSSQGSDTCYTSFSCHCCSRAAFAAKTGSICKTRRIFSPSCATAHSRPEMELHLPYKQDVCSSGRFRRFVVVSTWHRCGIGSPMR